MQLSLIFLTFFLYFIFYAAKKTARKISHNAVECIKFVLYFFFGTILFPAFTHVLFLFTFRFCIEFNKVFFFVGL